MKIIQVSKTHYWTVDDSGDVLSLDKLIKISDEQAWTDLRQDRDQRLAATDWRVTKEVEQAAITGLGLQVPLAWIEYRQALRDLPQNTTDPFNPVWPVEPK